MFSQVVHEVVLIAMISAPVLPAQLVSNGANADRSVTGTVVNPAGTPLDGSEIAVVTSDSVSEHTTTDANGHFRLDRVSPATLRLRVRHVGYQSRNVVVEAARAGTTTSVFVKLDPAVVVLDSVAISATAPDSSPVLAGFYMRSKTSHMGHFIGPDRLAQMKPELPSDALRVVPGVTVRPARFGNDVRIRGCAPLVWVDGMRAKGAQVDDLGKGSDLAAIEVYESLAGVPAEFTDRSATCGTILLWMKQR